MQATQSPRNQRHEVERQVHDLLQRSQAFQSLPGDEQNGLLENMTDIADVMVQNKLAQGGPQATALADPIIPGISVLPGTGPGSQQPPFTGGLQPDAPDPFGPKQAGDFGTGIATGVGQAGALLRQVNFPAFVAELVQGVFQAVVDASIQQMKAYGELVQSVTMSLNDFRDQNVTPNQGRDHLVSRYPTLMQVNITDQGPRVGLIPGVDEDDTPDFAGDLGISQSITALDDETIEEILVPAARNDLARSRQSLLATMLLMGINRIVVTDGKINAKMKFDFRATDSMVKTAQEYDYEDFGTTRVVQSEVDTGKETGENYRSRAGSGWGRWRKETGESSRWTKATTQISETPAIYLTGIEDTATSAELEAKAKLSGEVDLRFRTESFDLNQIATAGEIFQLQRVSGPGRGVPAPESGSAGGGSGTNADAGAGTTEPPATAP